MGRMRWRAMGAQGISTVVLALGLLVAGCSEDAVAPADEVAALVGDWEATSLIVTNVANPAIAPDLIELGASFTLNVQPSGQYTAILVVALQSSTEIGQIRVSGPNVTLQPTFPPGQSATSGTFSLNNGVLTIDGNTEFDFNLDGTPEPARAHFELVRK